MIHVVHGRSHRKAFLKGIGVMTEESEGECSGSLTQDHRWMFRTRNIRTYIFMDSAMNLWPSHCSTFQRLMCNLPRTLQLFIHAVTI